MPKNDTPVAPVLSEAELEAAEVAGWVSDGKGGWVRKESLPKDDAPAEPAPDQF